MRCKTCVMTNKIPGTEFKNCQCNICRNPLPIINKTKQKKCLTDFKKTIAKLKKHKGQYNCMVAFSGGKDSSHLLHMLKNEYGLKPLAVSVDTGYINPIAKENITRIIKKLDVDHIFIKVQQGMFNSIYKYFLKNSDKYPDILSENCNLCTGLMDIYMGMTAAEKNIPVIFSGVSPDEIYLLIDLFGSKDICYELDHKLVQNLINKRMPMIKKMNKKIVNLIQKYNKMKNLPRIIYPYHVLPYDANKMRKMLAKEGLIPENKSSPFVTNCLINDIMIYSIVKKRGYNPYAKMMSYTIKSEPNRRSNLIFVDRIIRLTVKLGLFKRKTINYVLKNLGLSKKDVT